MRFLFILLFLFPISLLAQTKQEILWLNQQAVDSMSTAPKISLRYSKEAVDIASKFKNDTLLALSYKNLGLGYYKTSQFGEAQKYYFNALKIYEGLKNNEEQYKILNNLGANANEWEEYDKAISFYKKAIEILNNLEKKHINLGTIYINIGLVYKNKKDFVQSFNYINQGLEIHEKANNKAGISLGLENLGDTYYENKEYQKALQTITKALAIAQEIGAKDLQLRDYNLLSKIYQALNNNLEAIKYAEKAYKLAEEANIPASIMGAHNLLASAYNNIQNYQLAYEHKDNAYNLKEIVFNEQKNKDIAGVEASYDTEKKNQQIANQKKVSWIIGTASGILIILAGFLIIVYYKKNQLKKKKNEELQAKNAEIEAQKAQIEEKNEEIDIKNQTLTTYNEQLETTLKELKIKNIEIESQKNHIEQQNHEIEEKNNTLTTYNEQLEITLKKLQAKTKQVNAQKLEIEEKNQTLTSYNEQLENTLKELQIKNTEIEAQKAYIEEQKAVIEEQNRLLENKVQERTSNLRAALKELTSTHIELNNFLYSASHDLHGPVASQEGIANLLRLEFEAKLLDPGYTDYMNRLHEATDKLRTTIKILQTIGNIKQEYKESFDGKSPIAEVNLYDFLTEVVLKEAEFKKALKKAEKNDIDTTLHIDIDKNIKLTTYTYTLHNLLLELCINAILYKNPHEKSIATIKVEQKEEKLYISVVNKGTVIKEEYKESIFKVFWKGEGAQGLGGGLYIAKIAAVKLRGQIYLKESNKERTEFMIEIPLLEKEELKTSILDIISNYSLDDNSQEAA